MAFDLNTLSWTLVHENEESGAKFYSCSEVADLIKGEMKCPCCTDIMVGYKLNGEQFDADIVAAAVEMELGPSLTKQ